MSVSVGFGNISTVVQFGDLILIPYFDCSLFLIHDVCLFSAVRQLSVVWVLL